MLTWRPRLDALELAGLGVVGVVAAALAAGAVKQPLTALVLVAVAGAAVVFLARTDLAILLVVATAPIEGEWVTGPRGISVTKLAGGLCIASFLFTLARQRGRRIVLEPGQAIVFGILGLALVSTLHAQDTSAALTTTTRYASFAAVYFIVTQFGHDRVLQRRICWTLAITCSVSAALGLHYYLNGSQTLATLPNANSNDFAFILATSLPFMFVLLNSRYRLLVAGMIGLVCGATLLSLSRGALLGVAAGFVLFVLTDRRRVQLTVAAGVIATIGVVLVIQSNPQRFHEAVLLKQQVAQENVTTRFQAWGAAARLASDHPLLGVGPGNFQFYYNKLTGQPVGAYTLTVAHNALLDISAELGVIAMSLFAVYLVLAFVRLTASLEKGYGDAAFVQALRISLTIAIVSAMFLSEQYFLPFWLIGGLAAAIWHEGRARAAPAE
jgi:putative inorganic carbon (HCO3(-)) transporter